MSFIADYVRYTERLLSALFAPTRVVCQQRDGVDAARVQIPAAAHDVGTDTVRVVAVVNGYWVRALAHVAVDVALALPASGGGSKPATAAAIVATRVRRRTDDAFVGLMKLSVQEPDASLADATALAGIARYAWSTVPTAAAAGESTMLLVHEPLGVGTAALPAGSGGVPVPVPAWTLIASAAAAECFLWHHPSKRPTRARIMDRVGAAVDDGVARALDDDVGELVHLETRYWSRHTNDQAFGHVDPLSQ